jgi:hypothetical protein
MKRDLEYTREEWGTNAAICGGNDMAQLLNRPQIHQIPSQRRLRFSLSLGIAAGVVGCLIIQFVATRIEALLFHSAWDTAVARTTSTKAFGQNPRKPAKMLSGINAKSFSPIQLAATTLKNEALTNVSPVAWNRLSSGDCITLTTKNGQTLSFRIMGSQPYPQQSNIPPKIDLRVTTCPAKGDAVIKAIIEPANQQVTQEEPRDL